MRATVTWPMVSRLASSAPRSRLVVAEQACRAAARRRCRCRAPCAGRRRWSRSGRADRSARSVAKILMSERGVALGVEHRAGRRRSADRLGQRLGGRPGQGVAGVEQPLQVRPAAGERRAELVDDGAQVVLVDRARPAGRGRAAACRCAAGCAVSGAGMRAAGGEVRARRRVRGCRSTYCSPTAERFSTTAMVSRGTATPRVAAAGRRARRPSVSRSRSTRPTVTPR